MARKASIVKAEKTPAFEVRKRNRCSDPGCGRARDFRRKFGLCGRHVRQGVLRGQVPGFRPISLYVCGLMDNYLKCKEHKNQFYKYPYLITKTNY